MAQKVQPRRLREASALFAAQRLDAAIQRTEKQRLERDVAALNVMPEFSGNSISEKTCINYRQTVHPIEAQCTIVIVCPILRCTKRWRSYGPCVRLEYQRY
jgi:hypothetical protein